jgi:penicillin-binding protein 2
VLANPLQLAVMAARIASGRAMVPRLLLDASTQPAPRSPPSIPSISRSSATRMLGGGQRRRHRRCGALPIPGITLGGKTGTAQVRASPWPNGDPACSSNASLPFKLRDHALFVCFAPCRQSALRRRDRARAPRPYVGPQSRHPDDRRATS